MTVALIFPGQGSQYPGMDRDLDRSTFEEADDALGFALSALIREGHESELQRTEITQPAIFTVSIPAFSAKPIAPSSTSSAGVAWKS